MPTRSISGVRIHFWQVVTRFLGGVTSPVKYFFIGAIPELISNKLLSSLGINGKLSKRRCPFDSKKERNFSLSSFNPFHFYTHPTSLFFKQKKTPHARAGTEESVVPPKLRLLTRRHSNSLTQKIRRGSSPQSSRLAEFLPKQKAFHQKQLSLCINGMKFYSFLCRSFYHIG